MSAPVPNVDLPAFIWLIHVSADVRLLLCVQLGVDAGHRRGVQRDVAQLRRPAQAEHRAAQRRPERVEVLHRVVAGRADPKELKTWLHAGQHGVKI